MSAFRRAAAVVALLSGAALTGSVQGCKNPLGCDNRTMVQEVNYGLYYDVDTMLLNLARSQGWACRDDGSIRNAFGGVIGTRYVCTICD